MAMIKCPKCRHHISSMARACPECGISIDSEWAGAEAERELRKLEDIPFTVEVGSGECEPAFPSPSDAGNECLPDGEEHEPVSDVPEELPEDEPKEQSAPAEPVSASVSSGGRRGWRAVLLFCLLLGLLIGGLCLYMYYEERQREERAYELLQGCSDPQFYEDFITRYRRSRHLEDVRERYKEVSARQEEWKSLVEKGGREELRQFVAQHPGSPYVPVARARIDSLDWAEVQELHTLEAVTSYLTAHPDGYYIAQAEVLRQMLERARIEAEALVAAQRDSLSAIEPKRALP